MIEITDIVNNDGHCYYCKGFHVPIHRIWTWEHSEFQNICPGCLRKLQETINEILGEELGRTIEEEAFWKNTVSSSKEYWINRLAREAMRDE